MQDILCRIIRLKTASVINLEEFLTKIVSIRRQNLCQISIKYVFFLHQLLVCKELLITGGDKTV